jgi:ABC-2 type transport system permease protein
MKGKHARYVKTLFRLSLRELMSLRFSSMLQAVFMMLNNLLFFIFWVLVYQHLETIRGISISHVAFLYAIACSSFGIAVFFFGGAFKMSEPIEKGVLDVYLTQPKNAQLQLMTSKTFVFGAGDFLSGVLLLSVYFGLSPAAWMYWFIGTIVASVLTVATMSLLHSIIFFIPRTSDVCSSLFDFFLSASIFPLSNFSTSARFFMLTILPGGFVGFFPMLAFKNAAPEMFLFSLLAALLYARLAHLVFQSGVRRYTSGSLAVQVR